MMDFQKEKYTLPERVNVMLDRNSGAWYTVAKEMNSMQSAPCIHKLDRPVLSERDVPYNARLVFNAGVTKYNGKYVMVL